MSILTIIQEVRPFGPSTLHLSQNRLRKYDWRLVAKINWCLHHARYKHASPMHGLVHTCLLSYMADHTVTHTSHFIFDNAPHNAVYRTYIRNVCVLGDNWMILDAPIDVSPFIETSDADELPALARRWPDKSRSILRQLVHTHLSNLDYTSISFSTLPAPEGGPYEPCTVICDKQFQKLNSRRAKTKCFILLVNLRLFSKK